MSGVFLSVEQKAVVGVGERNPEEPMKCALALAIIFIVWPAAILPTTAAPLNDRDAFAATKGQQRTNVRTNCTRQANAKKFGAHFIQRRNFIRDCMMEQGFR